MEEELFGRIALITGGREGMGRATAEFLAQKGASVVIVSRNEEELKKAAVEISEATKNENVLALAGDVSNTYDVEKIVNSVLRKYSRIDYLLNFAGYNVDYGRISPMRPNPEAVSLLEKIINVDLLGTFRMVSYVEPVMRRQNFGVIITIASTPVLDTWENDLLYQIAKVGNKQLAEVIAQQHRVDGITGVKIYCLAPGNIFNRSTYETLTEEQMKLANVEGWLDSRMHIAPIVYWLLIGKLKRESGSTIRIDASTAPNLFAEVGERYKPFIPPKRKE
jgi:NAD(P)-dependent dehydrogenase (short-subunit alcohol dehydrogenase family)